MFVSWLMTISYPSFNYFVSMSSGYTSGADVDIDIDVAIKPITPMIGTLDLSFSLRSSF
jgi:hypothetical protein